MATVNDSCIESAGGALPDRQPDGAEPHSDLELVAALKRGDNAAYETLVRSCGPTVMAVARRYMRSEADAGDCFQETFIAVTRSIDSYAGQSPLRQWVRGIAVNRCLMALRKRRSNHEESIDHMMPQFDDSGRRIQYAGQHGDAGIETQLEGRELQQTVRRCIQSLPDDYRVVILLRDIDGYSTRETATILGIEINAVKTRLHRARTALRFKLEPLLKQGAVDAYM